MTNISKVVFDVQELNILERKGYKIDLMPFNWGSYASVHKGLFVPTEKKVAIKVIDCEKVSEGYKNRFLPREMYVLRKLKHRFIIKKEEILTIYNRVFIIMEFAEGGDLHNMIRRKKRLDEMRAKLLFRQICEAFAYIHSEAIAHRDIKCENILLIDKKQTVAKVTDFGFARTCYDNQTGRRLLTQTQCGSVAFAGPELIKGPPFDAIRHDCWSIGVVLYSMIVGKLPFSPKLKPKKLLVYQMNRNYDLFDLDISDECKDILYKLLEPKPQIRLNMRQVLDHIWIKDIIV